MKHFVDSAVRIVLFLLTVLFWTWVLDLQLTVIVDLSIIVGGVLVVFPIAWLGRKLLDNDPTLSHVALITTVVHYAVVILAGVATVRAIKTLQHWPGWVLPVPTEIGLLLVIVTSAATLLAVINLALKGLGAPFAVALSRKLAVQAEAEKN